MAKGRGDREGRLETHAPFEPVAKGVGEAKVVIGGADVGRDGLEPVVLEEWDNGVVKATTRRRSEDWEGHSGDPKKEKGYTQVGGGLSQRGETALVVSTLVLA